MMKKKVKGSSSDRVSTGISNFDSLIEKGFEKNSTNLIIGASGSGKSIFATQFIIEGLKKGEKCLYVTFEEKRGEFFNNMKRFGWDLESYEKKGLLVFLEYMPEKVKLMLEEGGGAIENVITKNKISRMVIDSITSFEIMFDNELEKREAALELFNMLSSWNCTALLTYEKDPIKEAISGAKALEFECDSIINLYYLLNKGERETYLEIMKMRGTKHSRRIYKLKISDKGILVDKNSSSIELLKNA